MKPLLSDGPLQAFARFTDTQAMRDIWRERLSFEFNACSVQYARCRTYLNPQSWHKSFLCVCYQFDGVARSDTMHKPMLYGRAYLHGRSQEEFAALNQSSSARHLADLDMIVWPFPSDPELPQLPELLDNERVIDYFPYANMPFARSAIVNVKISVMRYRPEQRCILRYEIEYGPQSNRYVLYAKAFADDNGAQVFDRIQRCYDSAEALGARIARPVGYSAAMRTVWQEELQGEPLATLMDLGRYEMPIAAIGHCLAKLHAADFPIHRTQTRDQRLNDATKKSHKLGQMLPAVASQLSALISLAHIELAKLPPAPNAVIHGDVHFGQFLMTPDGALALFDFDEWTRGDPSQDLADLIVDSHVSIFTRDETKMNRVLPASVAGVLLASYRAHARWPINDETILWHARIQLINKAYRAAIQQEPYWREKVASLIAIATRGVDFGGSMPQEGSP